MPEYVEISQRTTFFPVVLSFHRVWVPGKHLYLLNHLTAPSVMFLKMTEQGVVVFPPCICFLGLYLSNHPLAKVLQSPPLS